MGFYKKSYLVQAIQNKLKKTVFSSKNRVTNHGTIYFNNIPRVKENIKKNVGLFLAMKLIFLEHINAIIKKVNKGVNVLKTTQFIITKFFR